MATDCNGWGLTNLVSLSPIVEGQSASIEPMEVTGGQEHISDQFTILSPQSQSVIFQCNFPKCFLYKCNYTGASGAYYYFSFLIVV